MSAEFEMVWQEGTDGVAVPTLVWGFGVIGALPTKEDVLEARDLYVATMNVSPERIDLTALRGAYWFGMEVVT